MAKVLYYDPSSPTAFSTLRKLAAVANSKSKSDIESWLLKQDVYTLHRFPRNPHNVRNVMEVWVCDLVDVQTLCKYNDKYLYLQTLIDLFLKSLHVVPLRSKTGTAVTSTFRSILAKYSKPLHRRPIWVRTDRDIEFLNRSFQDMLKVEGIQLQVYRYPNVQCAIV